MDPSAVVANWDIRSWTFENVIVPPWPNDVSMAPSDVNPERRGRLKLSLSTVIGPLSSPRSCTIRLDDHLAWMEIAVKSETAGGCERSVVDTVRG